MSRKRIRNKYWLLAFILFLLVFIEARCQAKSDFTIKAEPYEWTDEMRALEITTEDTGLTIKIIITNPDASEPIVINRLKFEIVLKKEGKTTTFYDFIEISRVYLPPKESCVIFFPVDVRRIEYNILGMYSTTLKYSVEGYSLKPVEPFNPFTFRILSQEQFQEEIQAKARPWVNITIPIKIEITGIAISILAIGIYILWRRKIC